MMKILFVEDDSSSISAFETSLSAWNEDHQDCTISAEMCKSYADAVAFLMSGGAFDLVGLIVDLTLADGEGTGNKLIKKLDGMHRRIPVIAFTATPDALECPYVLARMKKGENSYEEAFKRFSDAEKIGLTRILGCNGRIDLLLQQIFDVAIMPRFSSWYEYAKCHDATEAENALSRSVVEHLHAALDGDCSQFAPEEFYISKLAQSRYPRPGEVLKMKKDGNYYVVLSPSCDLALRENGKPKTDRFLVCEMERFKQVFEGNKGCLKKRLKKDGLDNNRIEELVRDTEGRLRRNIHAHYYHYFPAGALLEDAYLVNFRRLNTYQSEEFQKVFESIGIAVSPCFFRDIQSRFSSYYGRQGQPDIDFPKD